MNNRSVAGLFQHPQAIALIENWMPTNPGSHSGPKVGFEEISSDLLQARFSTVSGFADKPQLTVTRAFLRIDPPREQTIADCTYIGTVFTSFLNRAIFSS